MDRVVINSTLPGVPILGYNINITTFFNSTVLQNDVTTTNDGSTVLQI